MASSSGRILRVMAGIGLIAWGCFQEGGPNWALIIIGLVPLSAGLFDWCFFAPLFGRPFSGDRLRKNVFNA